MSRLDKLITIIETGSSPSIKLTAANQIGQIAGLRVRDNTTSIDNYVGTEGEWNEALTLIAKVR